MLGVLIVGTLSLVIPDVFHHPTVWSVFGYGYLFIPLVLPFVGLWWLRTHPPAAQADVQAEVGSEAPATEARR